MKGFTAEEYAFQITAVNGREGKNGSLDCRNGHEKRPDVRKDGKGKKEMMGC